MDRGAEIGAAGDAARSELEAKHRAREATLAASRQAIRTCAVAIRAVQRREFDVARDHIDAAGALIAEAAGATEHHHDVRYAGFLHDAQKEFAEANLTLAFVADEPMPTASEIGVETPAYPQRDGRKRRASCGARSSTASAGPTSTRPRACSPSWTRSTA